MALDILTTSQRGTYYANIETKCCVYIPNDSANVSEVLADMPTQIKARSHSSRSPNDWISSWFSRDGFRDDNKIFTCIIKYFLTYYFENFRLTEKLRRQQRVFIFHNVDILHDSNIIIEIRKLTLT